MIRFTGSGIPWVTGHSKRPLTPPLSVSASGLVSPSSSADSGRLGHCAVASRGA